MRLGHQSTPTLSCNSIRSTGLLSTLHPGGDCNQNISYHKDHWQMELGLSSRHLLWWPHTCAPPRAFCIGKCLVRYAFLSQSIFVSLNSVIWPLIFQIFIQRAILDFRSTLLLLLGIVGNVYLCKIFRTAVISEWKILTVIF